MTIIQTLILAVVEGVTEFLPVSSTGHMILVSRLLAIAQTEFVKSFEIAIQLGAMAAVAIIYRQRLQRDWECWKRIMVAFVPTGILGFLLYKLVKYWLLGNSWVVVGSLVIGGVIIIAVERWFKAKPTMTNLNQLSYRQAAIIGVGQSLAIIPGVSRSAATMVTGRFLGMDRPSAAEFSFLLAIPTMVAATGLDVVKSSWQFTSGEYGLLVWGMLGAFATAWFAVKTFITYVQTHTLTGFGIYRIVAGILFWLIILR